MKIAIVSDMHIGYDRFSEDAIRQARAAMELANNVADAVIIPGDVFDKRAPKPDVIAQAINLFRDAAAMKWNAKVVEFRGSTKNFSSVPVIAISGTHERTAAGKDNALNLMGLAGLLVDTSEGAAHLLFEVHSHGPIARRVDVGHVGRRQLNLAGCQIEIAGDLVA